jgi:polar amino acid transport system substrate-binding protein
MLRVGFDNPFRPLAWMQDGDAHGPLIERVRQVLAEAGFAARFLPYANEAIEPALAAGDIDLIAFKGILPQRASSLAFSWPILRTGTALFLPQGVHPVGGDEMAALAGRRLATPRSGPLAAVITANYPDVHLVLTANYDEALRLVASGDVAGAVLNLHVGVHAVRALGLPVAIPQRPFMDVDMAIATRFDLAAQFYPALNQAILQHRMLHYAQGPAQAI